MLYFLWSNNNKKKKKRRLSPKSYNLATASNQRVDPNSNHKKHRNRRFAGVQCSRWLT